MHLDASTEPEAYAAACRDVVQLYPSGAGTVAALRGIDADFVGGTVTAIVGPSGAGKSTLLRALAGLERPAAGEVWIAGQRTAHLRGRRRRELIARAVGYVHQRPAQNLFDYLTVEQHVNVAWRMRAAASDAERCDELVRMTGLAGIRKARLGKMSTGEQQRVAFAMAVAADPAVVIADEPTAELDGAETSALIDVIRRLATLGQTFVLSSHDPAVLHIADTVFLLRAGNLVGQLDADGQLFAVVDPAGRVPLPDEALPLFPDRRAQLTVDDDEVRLRRP